MKHLALTAIAAVTFLIAATPVLRSHSPQNQNPVTGQIQQIESPLQNTVEGMAKAKAPDLERSRLTRYRPEHPSMFK